MTGHEKYAFIFIVLAVLFQAMSAIFNKYAATSLVDISLVLIVTNVFYVLKMACLALQAVVWQMALKNYELSFAYPFMSLVNFIILFASFFIFNEGITAANVLGLFAISAGVYYLAKDGAAA
jgi:multidrug transporter EmrE-like cation transporter